MITTIASFGTAYAFVATSVIFWVSLRFFAKFLIPDSSKVIFGTFSILLAESLILLPPEFLKLLQG